MMNNELAKDLELNLPENIQPIGAVNEEATVAPIDLFASSRKDFENFDIEARAKKEGFKLPNFKGVTEKLEGLDSGLYLFAGISNHGKSAMMMNILYDACMHAENKLFALYFSLDDSKREIIPRLIAMDQCIPIGVAAKPVRYENLIAMLEESDREDNLSEEDSTAQANEYREQLRKRALGLERLISNSNKMKILDGSDDCTANTDKMYQFIKDVLVYLRAIDPEYKVIVALDSINDIRLTYKPSDNDVLGEVARVVKSWTVEFDCPIFASTHIRKNNNRRPVADDIKDSTVLRYEASVIWIVYNDVSEKKEAANIYQVVGEEKLPILELDWAKNKKSSYKGHTFCFFNPGYSKAIECDEEANKRYTGLLYSA